MRAGLRLLCKLSILLLIALVPPPGAEAAAAKASRPAATRPARPAAALAPRAATRAAPPPRAATRAAPAPRAATRAAPAPRAAAARRKTEPQAARARLPPSRPVPAPAPASTEPARIAAPLRAAPPPCPASLSAIGDGIQLCRCAPNQAAAGPVLGGTLYAGGSATCRAGLHAGVLGPRGGDLLIRALPLAGEAPGATRHRVASQPAVFEGRAYRLLAATPGQVDWARRLALALSMPNPPVPRASARAEELAPLPLPQAADLNDLLMRAPDGAETPGLDHLAPPALMPALWRTPVRPPDAPPPPEGAAALPLPPLTAPLPPPAHPGPVAGPAEVIGPARLLVSGVPVDLAGIAPGEGAEARLLGLFLARRGGTAHCAPPPAGAPGLRCSTGDGIDLAEVALYNGLARATPEAPDSYRYAERAAQEGRRGLWKAESR